jgi:hypothetical protein
MSGRRGESGFTEAELAAAAFSKMYATSSSSGNRDKKDRDRGERGSYYGGHNIDRKRKDRSRSGGRSDMRYRDRSRSPERRNDRRRDRSSENRHRPTGQLSSYNERSGSARERSLYQDYTGNKDLENPSIPAKGSQLIGRDKNILGETDSSNWRDKNDEGRSRSRSRSRSVSKDRRGTAEREYWNHDKWFQEKTTRDKR